MSGKVKCMNQTVDRADVLHCSYCGTYVLKALYRKAGQKCSDSKCRKPLIVSGEDAYNGVKATVSRCKCGYLHLVDAKFCENCGDRLMFEMMQKSFKYEKSQAELLATKRQLEKVEEELKRYEAAAGISNVDTNVSKSSGNELTLEDEVDLDELEFDSQCFKEEVDTLKTGAKER